MTNALVLQQNKKIIHEMIIVISSSRVTNHLSDYCIGLINSNFVYITDSTLFELIAVCHLLSYSEWLALWYWIQC